MDKLLVAVLGNRNAGKSHTWNTLFGRTVKTGKTPRQLEVQSGRSVEVFLVSGSPEERELYVAEIIANVEARIVLCSLQYTHSIYRSLEYFADHGYSGYVHWLNPGYSDDTRQEDHLAIIPYLLDHGFLLGVRDGHAPAQRRVDEMRSSIFGWASARDLIEYPCTRHEPLDPVQSDAPG